MAMNGGVSGKPTKQNSYRGPQPMRKLSLLAAPWAPQIDPQGIGQNLGETRRCVIEWAQLQNTSAADRYFKFFDLQNAPTLGTDVPVLTVFVATKQSFLIGKTYFANGIWIIACTTAADATNTAASAGDCLVNGAFVNP